MIVLVEDGRDDGAKLAQAGEEFLFELARLRGEILDPEIDEVSLPELRRATASDRGRPLENANAHPGALQGLGATQSGKACSYNRDGYGFLHRGNVGRDCKRGQAR